MNVKKVFWAMRAARLSLFTKIKMPSYLGKPVFMSSVKGLECGPKTRIYPGMRLETDGTGRLIVGENTSIGQNFHAVACQSNLIIGRDVTVSGNVFITNCDHTYEKIGVHILEQPLVYKETVIGDNCFIGYGAVIQAGSRLGNQCIVGANSVVKGVYPDCCVIAGVPAKIKKRYNRQTGEWEKA